MIVNLKYTCSIWVCFCCVRHSILSGLQHSIKKTRCLRVGSNALNSKIFNVYYGVDMIKPFPVDLIDKKQWYIIKEAHVVCYVYIPVKWKSHGTQSYLEYDVHTQDLGLRKMYVTMKWIAWIVSMNVHL